MPTPFPRRPVLAALLAGFVSSVLPGALAAAQESGAVASPTADSAFVQSLGAKLTAIVNGPGDLADKKQAILPLIDQNVDVNAIGRFCLGRYWRLATPAQQQRFLQLFHRVLVNSITDKIGQYKGVTFQLGATQIRNGESYVTTIINRPGQPPANVQWVVSHATGAPRVVDVYGEGVSLALTQRADYESYVARNGNSVDALIAALQRQVSRGT